MFIHSINNKSVSNLIIPIKISFKEASKTLWDLITKGGKVRYKLHLTFKIESENNMMKNSKVILESTGSVKSVTEVSQVKFRPLALMSACQN
jgi:hypothetical protein